MDPKLVEVGLEVARDAVDARSLPALSKASAVSAMVKAPHCRGTMQVYLWDLY